MRHLARFLAPAGLGILVCTIALAQQPTGEITGLITDVSKAAVPGAAIDAINTGTGLHWSAVSNDSGNYVLSTLPPGNYSLTVKKQGFATETHTAIELTVSQVARLDFTLNVGSTTETVQVTGSAALLETDTASTGQLIATKPINDLPLNGRNFLQLAKLSMRRHRT